MILGHLSEYLPNFPHPIRNYYSATIKTTVVLLPRSKRLPTLGGCLFLVDILIYYFQAKEDNMRTQEKKIVYFSVYFLKTLVMTFIILLGFLRAEIVQSQELPADPYQRGLALYLQGKYAEAMSSFEMALEAEPENIDFLYRRALCLLKLNETDAAREVFSHILEIAPEAGLGLSGQALILMQEKNYEEALNKVNVALTQEPGLSEAHFVKGLILSYQQKVDEALKALNRCVELAPAHAYGHYHLGLAYNQKKRKDLTIVHLEKFLTLAPLAPEAAQVRTLLNFLRR